ncbi:hypothetical protein TPA0598_17_00180 [Streptomyces lydicamycinicus]|uniref:Uncharacterized protein n=1 Tax=Streptomyces lydicamycinicus TaxID=1546107 RepID=A0A0P4RIC5_9ACTN|nr:hypothetical protein [Streptomyces lydicamycinicus]GAO13037.1 hypothetical protein TPA0598_17_00180 [Streptomyces lydicamycinicus]
MTSPDPDPDWLFKAEAESRSTEAEEARSAEFVEAAESLRSAAEYMREMAAPVAPPKERNWDISWFTNWIKYAPTGRALKVAAFTTGPLSAFVLWRFHQESDASGAAFAVFAGMLLGIVHVVKQAQFTRVLLWGPFVGLVYYPPAIISAAFNAAKALFVGGA